MVKGQDEKLRLIEETARAYKSSHRKLELKSVLLGLCMDNSACVRLSAIDAIWLEKLFALTKYSAGLLIRDSDPFFRVSVVFLATLHRMPGWSKRLVMDVLANDPSPLVRNYALSSLVLYDKAELIEVAKGKIALMTESERAIYNVVLFAAELEDQLVSYDALSRIYWRDLYNVFRIAAGICSTGDYSLDRERQLREHFHGFLHHPELDKAKFKSWVDAFPPVGG